MYVRFPIWKPSKNVLQILCLIYRYVRIFWNTFQKLEVYIIRGLIEIFLNIPTHMCVKESSRLHFIVHLANSGLQPCYSQIVVKIIKFYNSISHFWCWLLDIFLIIKANTKWHLVYSKNCLLKKRVYGIQLIDLPLHVKLNSTIQQGTKLHFLPP